MYPQFFVAAVNFDPTDLYSSNNLFAFKFIYVLQVHHSMYTKHSFSFILLQWPKEKQFVKSLIFWRLNTVYLAYTHVPEPFLLYLQQNGSIENE